MAMRRLVVCVGVTVVTAVCAIACKNEGGSGSPSAHEGVSFRTVDGVELHAAMYPVAGARPPGLILLHGQGSNKESWSLFALRAQQAGYQCLAVDVRGHGQSVQSPAGEALSHRTFRPKDWRAVLLDIASAKDALLERGTDPENLALVGSGIGANLVLEYAVSDPDIQAVVLVSPGLNLEGVRPLEAVARYGKRPILLATTRGDAYAASSCAALKAAASGFSELVEYDGGAHGTDVFSVHPECVGQILLWLDAVIGPHPDNGADHSPGGG